MGLAGTKVKQRFGLDPRNTNWANDTSRFGAKHLSKLGWEPGKGLGLVPHANTTHVKVVLKDDNVGLGAKLAKKEKQDEFDSGECTGLDVFQRLLGRLNGREDTVGEELERQRKDKIINGKWGIAFVKGDVLRSTWDAESKTIISYHNKEEDSGKVDKKKKKDKKKKEKDSSSKSKSKSKKRKSDDVESSQEEEEQEDKKAKKLKKEKKEKKEKKDKKSKDKKEKKRAEDITRESMLAPKESTPEAPQEIHTRLSVRSRWIKQKRAAVMDAKALNEIFMVTN